MSVTGAPRPVKGNGAALTGEALRLIANANPGGMVTVVTNYKEPSGRVLRQNAVYTVK